MAPTKRKTSTDDLESQLLKLLKETIGGMDKKLDDISKRLTKLENAVFPPPVPLQKLPPWYRDTALLKLLSLIVGGLIIVLTIIASLKGVKLPNVLGL